VFAGRGSCPPRSVCTSGNMQVAAKLASVFPAVETAAIAEALRKAGGDTQLAAEVLLPQLDAEALLSVAPGPRQVVKARPRL
jgi:hypothetical protein